MAAVNRGLQVAGSSMRLIRLIEHIGIERLSPTTWRNLDDQGALVVAPPRNLKAFFCMLVQVQGGRAPSHITFDCDLGRGFEESSTVSLLMFPLGFYHLPPTTLGSVKRIRIRLPCKGATFRSVMFESVRPVPVAALHYLFNLRYQNVKAFTGSRNRSRMELLRSNVGRIRKFLSGVAQGEGVREQQVEGDLLRRIIAAQATWVMPVRAAMEQRWASRIERPLISFVTPVYETPPAYLGDLVDSFASEQAAYAELVLADDGSRSEATVAALAQAATRPGVRVVTMARNGGIAAATNAGIAAARGEWVSFIDHDDAFVTGAIPIIAKAVADHPDASFFYTDELICDAGMTILGSLCKPAFDPVLLSGVNYINHFSVFRRGRVIELGSLAPDREGSQDYDLVLRYLAGTTPGSVVHIPYLAYRWRRGEDSYSTLHRDRSVNNARRALAGSYGGAGHDVDVQPATLLPNLHRVRFAGAARPLVSVVIPNRDSLALITRVVTDLLDRTHYADIEIIVPDNGSQDPEVLAFYEAHRSRSFFAEVVPERFNFSRMCNRGVRHASGDVLLFLNNDIEIIEPDWLAEMVECLSFPGTGIVGAKLLYPDGRIQHAGVIVGLGEAAGHWFVESASSEPGPMGRLAVRQTMSAVTGACMLVTRRCFEAVGGFDEVAFPIAYNDIDFCVRARSVGYRTVWTPFATLRHHESTSRGSDETGGNRERLKNDIAKLQERHGTRTLIDQAFSPFYDRRSAQTRLRVPSELPVARPDTLA